MNRSGAYDIMEREYVTCSPGAEANNTITAIAGRYNRGKSSVARMSRLRHWKEKRVAYRRKSGEIITDLDIDAYATRLHQIHGDFIDVAEETLKAYSRGLRSGEVKPTAGDVARMVTLVRDIVNKPVGNDGDGKEDDGGIRLPESVALELVGAVERIARGRLDAGTGERPAEPKPVGSSEDGRIQVR